MPSKELTIPYEVADRIALAVMKDQLKYLEKELRDHDKKGEWLHPEDAENSRQHLIPSLKTLIKYFGG